MDVVLHHIHVLWILDRLGESGRQLLDDDIRETFGGGDDDIVFKNNISIVVMMNVMEKLKKVKHHLISINL